MAQVEFSRYLKNISYFIVPLVAIFLMNSSKLSIIIFLFTLYNIYLFLSIYYALLDKNGPGLSKFIRKLSFAIIIETIILLAYNFINLDNIFLTKNIEVIKSTNILSLII